MTRQLLLAAVVLVLAATDCAARPLRPFRGGDDRFDDRFEMDHRFRGNIAERLICRGTNETNLPNISGSLLPDAARNLWEDWPDKDSDWPGKDSDWLDMPDMPDDDMHIQRRQPGGRMGWDWDEFDSDYDYWDCDPETDRFLCLPIFPRPGYGNRTLAIPEVQELFQNLMLFFDNGTFTTYAQFDDYVTTAAQPILDLGNITVGIDMLKEMIWHHLVKSGHIPAGTIGPDGKPVPEDAGRRWDDDYHHDKWMNLTGYWVSHDNNHWDNNRTETSGNTSLHFFWTPAVTLFSHDGVNYSLCSHPKHDDHWHREDYGHHDRHHRHNRTEPVAETTFVATFATLSLDQWTSDDQAVFVRAFQVDLAQSVGAASPDHVVVQKVSAGSVVVEASILFDTTQDASTAAAKLTDAPADVLSETFKATYGEATLTDVAVETPESGGGDTDMDTDMGESDKEGDKEESDKDTDEDTIPDKVENLGGKPAKKGAKPVDSDGDKIPDYKDSDSDGDKIPDRTETSGDQDGDKIADYLDRDVDADGQADCGEGQKDPDHDNIPNYRDQDRDGDGITDKEEHKAGLPLPKPGAKTPAAKAAAPKKK